MRRYENADFFIKLAIPSLFLAGLVPLIYNPLSDIYPNGAIDTMGLGLANGVSIGKIIVHMFVWYLVAFLLVAAMFFLLFIRLGRVAKWGEAPMGRHVHFMAIVSLLGMPALVLAYSMRLRSEAGAFYYPDIPLLVAIIILEYFAYHFLCSALKKTALEREKMEWVWVVSFLAAFPAMHLVTVMGVPAFKHLWLLCFLLLSVFALPIGHWIFSRNEMHFTHSAKMLLPPCFAALLTAVYIEIRNVAAQHGILLRHPNRNILVVYALLLLCGGCVGVLSYRGKWKCSFSRWKNYYYPLVLITLLAIAFLPRPIVYSGALDYFEHGNQGVPLSQFILFGKIPIVESFSAHVLSDFWGPYFYSLLNGDMVTAVVASGIRYPLSAFYDVFKCFFAPLALYKILSSFFDKSFALGFCVLFPLYAPAFGDIAVPIVCVVALIYILKNPSWKSYIVFAVTLAFSVLYQLDYGLAFSLGTFATLIILWLMNRKRRPFVLWQFVVSLAGTIVALFAIFAGICVVKHIPLWQRIAEILSLVMSNDYWAYGTLGDVTSNAYTFFYVAMPFVSIIFIAGILFVAKKRLARISVTGLGIVLSFGIAYIVNLPRIMVRHTVGEIWIMPLMFGLPLFLAFAVALLATKGKRGIFVFTCIGVMLAGNSSINTTVLRANSYADMSINRYSEQDFIPSEVMTDKRIVWENEDAVAGVIGFLDEILMREETFVDLSNHGLLYTLTERECPFYLSQSPALISNTLLQEQFIRQIEEYGARAPIVLTSIYHSSLDGISYHDRQPLIYEYLYAEYMPLCRVDEFVLWCKIERKAKYEEQIKELGAHSVGIEQVIALQGAENNLGEMPYLWGRRLESSSDITELLSGFTSKDGLIDIRLISLKNAAPYYLCIGIDAQSSDEGALAMAGLYDGNEIILKQYGFNIHEGSNIYLFRVSANYFWQEGFVDELKVYVNNEEVECEVRLIQGDIMQ